MDGAIKLLALGVLLAIAVWLGRVRLESAPESIPCKCAKCQSCEEGR